MNVGVETETRAETELNSFDSFFAANYAPLARALYRVVGDVHLAEELAAEAFWRLHIRPPRSQDNVAGWLYRTGLRLALDHLKKQKRRQRYEAMAAPPEAAPDPLETLERREQANRLRKALAALKTEQASLLILRSEGHSLSDIAAILGLNPNSVGTLLARADAALRKEYLKRYGKH